MSYGGGEGAGCLTGSRFTMSATLLKQSDDILDLPVDPDLFGSWVKNQDPLTKEIVRIWKPFEVTPDNPGTPDVDEQRFKEIDCLARGIVDGGIRVAGTTERFGDTYENIDFVKLWVPGNVRLTKRDRITNIKDASGHIRWRDEEYEEYDPTNPASMDVYNNSLKATLFNINGVTPLFDAFNNIKEWFVLLEKSEVGTNEG